MPAPFDSLAGFRALLADAPAPHAMALLAAEERNAMLTKPPGALGRLEEIAVWYAAWRGDPRPQITRPQIAIFAGNHGIAAQGVSAFPAEVTAQMVGNFEAGGAAINQLARTFGADFSVTPLALDTPTADFTAAPAMTEDEVVAALAAGWEALGPETDLFIPGEMGIGNTTSAAAIGAALFGGSGADWCGRGTGVDDAGLDRKVAVVEAGLAAHAGHLDDSLEVLRRLGGREIAAMAGAIACARMARVPVILDGFIATSAAAVLAQAAPGALDHVIAGHASDEAGHMRFLNEIGLDPILSLGMRLGEGSGGALALGVLQGAVACHSGMARFDEAGVSEG